MIGAKLGPYEVSEKLGQGGMATVYRAHQPSVGRDVAIKVITGAVSRDAEAVERFQREARIIARLEHVHILPVYDFDGGHDPPYIVMRCLDGGTLKDVLEQGRLPPAEISHLMRQVALALDYAHRQGVVHRDVKPSNILVDREGNAYVTDFGLARMIGSDRLGEGLTGAGTIVGTPEYISPEQAIGGAIVDHRADVYALGVVLFEMLTGELPFLSDTWMRVLMMHVREPIPSAVQRNPSLPLEADAVITRALAKRPEDRYPSVLALTEAVEGTLGATPSPTRLREAARRSAILRGAQPVVEERRTPSERNKTVTVLHASAAEYAEIVDEVSGPEAARRALQELWAAVSEIVEARGGLVLGRMEDTMLALWGAEIAREDDAERAIRAALGVQAALREQGASVLGEEEDEPLPLRIGVHTGLALLTPGERSGEYTASGATISLANRLAQDADGTILISHDTYSQVRGVFDMEPDNALRVRRGRGSPRQELRVYRVLDAKARAFRRSARGVEGVETRMVGREAELRALQNAFLDAVEDRETQVITVLGAPGLGKSRLLWEFTEWSDLRPERFWLLRGRATPEMTSRPYALFRDLLAFRFEIHDNDPPVVVRAKLEQGIWGQIGPDEELAHLVGHLAGYDLSGSPVINELQADPEQLARRARYAFARWLVRLCAEDPVVIELEDIHHADETTLDLIATLLSQHPDLPLLVVCLARPTLLERRPTWGSGQDYHSLLTLHPLDRRQSRALVREIVRKVSEVPRALRDLLVERSEGNPYYLEELVKMLIDERVILKESEEAWRVDEARIARLRVPTTLVGLLQARLDGLLYPERLTLQRAAVVGRVFWDSTLVALDAADEAHVDDLPGVLRRLAEGEYIHLRETSAFEGSAEYVFGGNMMRDVLLDMLLRRQRRAYNRAAAEWLVEVSGERVEEYDGTVAGYYERGGEPTKAARHLRRAGETALRTSTHVEARALLERALRLLPEEDPGRLALRLRLGEAHVRLSDYDAAREVLGEALEVAREREEPERVAEALYWLGQVSTVEGDYARAKGDLEASLSLAREGRDRAVLAQALYGLGDLHWRLDEMDEALMCCTEGLSLARQIGDATLELYTLNRLAVVTFRRGDIDGGQRLFEEMYDRALQVGNRERAAAALNNLGQVAYGRGDLDGARAYCRRALPLTRATGDQQGIAYLLANLAGHSASLSDYEASRQYLREGLALALRVGALPTVLAGVTSAALMLARQGDVSRGLALLGMNLYHPAADSESRWSVHDVLQQLDLDEEDPAVLAGLEAGRSLALEAVAAELLAEMGEPGE